LPLSGLAIQSVTGKWLGPLKAWPQFFKVFKDKGYNMIHFTPLNHRGDSNSPYSIYNQLSFAPDLFEPGTTIDEQHVQINEMTDRMEKEFGLLSLTDVVWNHTAENSDWLQDHPEAGYNLHNSPHLISAYQLDSALLDFSSNLRNLGYPSNIYTMDDLLKLMEGIKTHVLGGCRLWEFYVVDVTRHVEDTINVWKEGAYVKGLARHFDCKNLAIQDKCQAVKGYLLRDDGVLGERFKRTIDVSSAACYLYSLFGEYKAENVTNAQRELTNVFNELNLPFYKEFDADRETILESLFNRIKYVRLDLKQPEISERYLVLLWRLLMSATPLSSLFSRVFHTMNVP
jgi:glycogen debranching enzyme